MKIPRELLREWEARLEAEGLGRVENKRRTEAVHVRRRYSAAKAAYWRMTQEFAAWLWDCGRAWLSARHGLGRLIIGDLTPRDMAVWRMHAAGLPRWMIAAGLGLDLDGRDVRTSIERCRRQMRSWRRLEEQASAAELAGYGAAAEIAAVLIQERKRGVQ